MIVARTRRRLALTYVAAMAVLILVLGGGIVAALDAFLLARETDSVRSDAAQAAVEFSEYTESGFQSRHSSYSAGTFYVVWSATGNPIFNPANVDAQPLRAAALNAVAGHATTVTLALHGSGDALVASQALIEDGSPVGALQAGHSLAARRTVENEVILLVLVASAAVLLLSVAAGWWMAGRALIPVRGALDRHRSFTADASHELRSPLTVIDTGIQMLRRHPDRKIGDYDDVLGSMQDESGRMGRLVSSLLTLARADTEDAQLQLSEVDAADLVRAAVKDLEPLAAAKGCVIDAPAVEKVVAQIDADRFKQLIVILVDNAVTHGPQGGRVEVSCLRRDHNLVLEVADHGPGIPPAERDRVFERF
ncbi:MAG TPA: HAMP domain-containing sensor histidine kinase, partial [Patescibacteria group bacterium]|nr:HAMP domain-containing sensor histidine kinase [Patescibacteria group bacterium]